MIIRLAPWAAVYLLGCATVSHTGQSKPSLDGETFLRSVSSSKCAQVDAASSENGAAISQWDCLMRDNLKWTFESAGGGAYFIKNHDGKCLEVAGASPANGAPIDQWDCSNQDNEKWTIDSAGGGAYHLKAMNSGKCAQVSGGATQNGAALSQWECSSQDNMKWKLVPVRQAVEDNDFVREEPGLPPPRTVPATEPLKDPPPPARPECR